MWQNRRNGRSARLSGNKYTNVYNQEMLFNQLLGYVINQSQQNAEILESTDAYQMLQSRDPWNETEYLVMWGNFEDGSQFLMRSPLESMRESAAISNRVSDIYRKCSDPGGGRPGVVLFKKADRSDPGAGEPVR